MVTNLESLALGMEKMERVFVGVNDKRLIVMTEMTLKDRLKSFIDNEMRSCSMDIGGITPLYVYRMWGGKVAIEKIAKAMEEVRRLMCN